MLSTTLPHDLHVLVNVIDLLGWGALLLFPRRSLVNFWWAGLIVPLMLSFIYIYSLLTFWFLPPAMDFANFINLEGVHKMFENRGMLLVAWINLSAMDLVAGAWMARKATQVKIPNVYLIPCLIMTYIFVGFGFTMFVAVAAAGGKWRVIARREAIPAPDSAPVEAQPFAA